MSFRSSFLLLFVIIALLAACKRSEQLQGTSQPAASPAAAQQQSPGNQAGTPATGTNASSKAKTDACALLTSADIEAVQKESVRDTKLSGSSDGGFSVSQCFFTLPTFTNSISLQVTQRGDGSGARDPKEFWTETFHRERKSEKEREREKAKSEEEEEERDKAPPKKVGGVGDEAFWVGSRIGGALYVLKDNSYVRVSIGGAVPETEKLKRSKSLAQKVTERL
jgi:hypothetical protein